MDSAASKTSRTALLRYGVSLFTVGLALLLTLQVEPLAERTPFALFFAAVLLSTWYGGRKLDLLAIALATLAGDYFLIPPVHTLMVGRDSILQLGTFILVALLINWLTAARQHSKKAMHESENKYRMLVEQASDGIAIFDLKGNFIEVNRVSARSSAIRPTNFFNVI